MKASQSVDERERLNAAWAQAPAVAAYDAAVREFIAREGLGLTVEGWNRTADFSTAWFGEHGHLPDSGIKMDG